MAVTWDIQAQRLQLVSASFLDAQPLLSQTPSSEEKSQFRIEGKSIVTFLPKLNGTVGGKTEQPPQPPAHSIPTVEVDYQSKTTFLTVNFTQIQIAFQKPLAIPDSGVVAINAIWI
jgi:hypothetical protein